jgi:hypothetical protein
LETSVLQPPGTSTAQKSPSQSSDRDAERILEKHVVFRKLRSPSATWPPLDTLQRFPIYRIRLD